MARQSVVAERQAWVDKLDVVQGMAAVEDIPDDCMPGFVVLSAMPDLVLREDFGGCSDPCSEAVVVRRLEPLVEACCTPQASGHIRLGTLLLVESLVAVPKAFVDTHTVQAARRTVLDNRCSRRHLEGEQGYPALFSPAKSTPHRYEGRDYHIPRN